MAVVEVRVWVLLEVDEEVAALERDWVAVEMAAEVAAREQVAAETAEVVAA